MRQRELEAYFLHFCVRQLWLSRFFKIQYQLSRLLNGNVNVGQASITIDCFISNANELLLNNKQCFDFFKLLVLCGLVGVLSKRL